MLKGENRRVIFQMKETIEQRQSETPPTSVTFAAKKKQLLSTAMKRTTEWISSQELPSDITVRTGGASFSLHKFPLVSRCGYIKKLISKAKDSGIAVIEIPDVPGGAEAFELAAKFCYGINFKIGVENIAMLRCAAEYLEMTEEYAVGNLVSRTEAYLNEVALKNLSGAISVLRKSEKLLPLAEKVKLVSNSIDAVASLVMEASQLCSPRPPLDSNERVQSSLGLYSKPIVDWWAEELTILSIDIFQRVIMAMIARGFKPIALSPVLMLYAQNSLGGLEIFGTDRSKIEPKHDHEKRIILETIVGLMPREKDAVSVSFLSMLLRSAIHLEAMVSCRLDLEKRIGMQLEQAVLDDLLIPSFSTAGGTLFDVDTVNRIVRNYFKHKREGNNPIGVLNNYVSPPLGGMERVASLMEVYLSEIACDRNLSVSKFISIADLIPEQARKEDSMYKSIDIYLKAHPALSQLEKKQVCSLMNCQKLSREASSHAAQNDRLPVHTMVQVLYHEQQGLQNVISDNLMGVESPLLSHKFNVLSANIQPAPTEFSSLHRENENLKMELIGMRMRLKELEKSVISSPVSSTSSRTDKLQLPKKSIMSTMSKRFGRLYPFMRSDGGKTPSEKNQLKARRSRRHSIS